MNQSLLAVIGVSVLLGARHAFEPDHLAAVSLLATRERRLWPVLGLGAIWGVGHSASLALVAIAVIAGGVELPPALGSVTELAVAVLLIAVGLPVLWRYASGRWHMHVHSHGGVPHMHLHSHSHGPAHVHTHSRGDAGRSGIFGLIHGLAGSGAIVVLLLASAPSAEVQVVWFGAFALGSIVGMAGVSLVVGMLVRATTNEARGTTLLHVGSALAAVAIGVLWAGRTLFVM